MISLTDLRILSLSSPFPLQKKRKKKENELGTHHFWVIDPGSEYLGQFSLEQREKPPALQPRGVCRREGTQTFISSTEK